MRLRQGLYAYPWTDPWQNNCNSFVLGPRPLVLVDPGHRRFLPRLFSAMRRDGLNPEELDLVVVTHGHPDHLEGVEDLQALGVPMAMHPEEERFVRGEGAQIFHALGLEVPRVRALAHLEEGELVLGGWRLEVLHTPGHSPGSICLWCPEDGVLLSGDLLFAWGMGRVDLPGSDPAAMRLSLERVFRLPVRLLLPGHGEFLEGRDAYLENAQYLRQAFF